MIKTEETAGGAPREAIPGTGIRVRRELLLPLEVTGTFFAVGLIAFASLPVLLAIAKPHLAAAAIHRPEVLVIVHMIALGYGTSVALGAWQQLSIVALQAPGSPSLTPVWASLALFLTGLPMLLIGLYTNMHYQVLMGGVFVTAAFFAAVRTTLGARAAAERGTVMSPFIVGAFMSLLAVGVVGVLLALNRATGWLGSWYTATLQWHVYLGPVGWFGLLIPGVSYELAPFFGVTRGTDRAAGRGQFPRLVFALILLGIAAGLSGAVVGWSHPVLLLPLSVGYLLFVVDLRGVYRRRGGTRRTAIVAGVRASHTWLAIGAALLLAVAVFHGPMSDVRWAMGIGWIAGAGWIGNAIAGYLHRILPFLLWHHRYWGKKKEDVKTSFPKMVHQNLGRVGFWLYNPGVAAVLAGLWFEPLLMPGIALTAAGTWVLVFNLARAYFR